MSKKFWFLLFLAVAANAVLAVWLGWMALPLVFVYFAIAYYLIPNILVREFGVDYKKKEVRGRFVKPEPNHALIAVLGGKKRRVIMGVNFRLFRGDIHGSGVGANEGDLRRPPNLEGSNGLWVVPRKRGEPEEIGGNLDLLVGLLDSWVYGVTGYRVIGSNIADLIGAELATYLLGRPGKDNDTSHYVELSKQVFPYEVVNADTGGMEPIVVGDKTYQFQSAVEISARGQTTYVVRNLDLVFFGINDYLGNLRQIITAALVEAVRAGTADSLRSEEWIRKTFDPAPLLKNGKIPPALIPYYKNEFEIREETVNKPEFTARWEAARSITGAVVDFGLMITGSRNDMIDFSADFKDFLAGVQKKLRQLAQDAQIAQGNVMIADLQRQADIHLAEGRAAYTGKELGELAQAAQGLATVLGDSTLATMILAEQQRSTAARNASGGATVFLGGGQQITPVVDASPRKPTAAPAPGTGPSAAPAPSSTP